MGVNVIVSSSNIIVTESTVFGTVSEEFKKSGITRYMHAGIATES